jgi:hypothetical protein
MPTLLATHSRAEGWHCHVITITVHVDDALMVAAATLARHTETADAIGAHVAECHGLQLLHRLWIGHIKHRENTGLKTGQMSVYQIAK